VPCAGAHVAEAEAVEVEVKEQMLLILLTDEHVAKAPQIVAELVLQAEPTDAVEVPVGPAVALPEEDDEDPEDATKLPLLSNGLCVPGKA